MTLFLFRSLRAKEEFETLAFAKKSFGKALSDIVYSSKGLASAS